MVWRDGRRHGLVDANGTQNRRSPDGARRQATRQLSVGALDVNQTDRLEYLQSVGGRKVETKGFEFSFEGAMNQKSECGYEDMSAHSLLALVEYGLHLNYIFDATKTALYFVEFFVKADCLLSS